MKESRNSLARRSASQHGESARTRDDETSPTQSVRRETLLAFVWANRGDADSTIRALSAGTLVLTGNFKGLESEIARQATTTPIAGDERRPRHQGRKGSHDSI